VSTLEEVRRYRIDRALADAYTSLRPQVVSTVSRRVSQIPRDEVEAAYNQACFSYWRALDEGQEIPNPLGWLVGTTFHKAVDEGRRLRFHRRSNIDVGRLRDQNGVFAGIDEEITAASLQRRLGELFSEQELQILELHCLGKLTREEVAERLGLTARQVKRAVLGKTEGARIARQGIRHKVAQLVHEVIDGEPCENRREQVAAYARGLALTDAESAEVEKHITGCRACAGYVRGMRGLLSILPPELLPPVAAASGADEQSLEQMRALAEAAPDTLRDLVEATAGAALGGGGVAAVAAGAGSGASGAAVSGTAAGAAAGVASGSGLVGGTVAKLCAGAAAVCAAAAAGAGVATDVTRPPDGSDNERPPVLVQPSVPVKDETDNVEPIPETVPTPQPTPTPEPAPPQPEPEPVAQPPEPAPPPPPPPQQEQFDPAAAADATPAQSSSSPQRPAPSSSGAVGEFLGGP